MLFAVLDLLFNLAHGVGYLLEGLIFGIVKQLLLVRNALDLVFNVRVPSDSLASLKVLHEVAEVFSSALEDALGTVQDGDFALDL